MAILSAHSGNLSFTQAKHLLNRLTFGYTAAELDDFVNMPVSTAVDNLFDFSNIYPSLPIDPATGATWVETGRTSENSNNGSLRRVLRNWMTDLMIAETTALEKLVFFWHTHYTTQSIAVSRTEAVYHQNQLFRLYAKGNFKTLSHKICRDAAILYFLSGFSNEKNNPNENFARELLELYTIGKGPQIADGNYTTYTEDDVREAARILTGYKVYSDYTTESRDADTNLLRARINTSRHDDTDKVFSSAFQNTTITGSNTADGIERELSDFINMIFGQMATARNIVIELYRFFVYPNISAQIMISVVEPLAQELFNNGYEIEPILKDLFNSEHFYDLDNYDDTTQNHIGALISAPVHHSVRLCKYFDVQFPDQQTDYANFLNQHRFLEQHVEKMGMILYEPTETAGWPAYHQDPFYDRAWISENAIIERFLFGDKYISGKKANGGNMEIKIDIVKYLLDGHISDPYDPIVIIEELTNGLTPLGVSQERKDYYKNFLIDPTEPEYYWSLEWGEFQNTNNDGVVKSRLENMLKAILQSPESQLV